MINEANKILMKMNIKIKDQKKKFGEKRMLLRKKEWKKNKEKNKECKKQKEIGKIDMKEINLLGEGEEEEEEELGDVKIQQQRIEVDAILAEKKVIMHANAPRKKKKTVKEKRLATPVEKKDISVEIVQTNKKVNKHVKDKKIKGNVISVEKKVILKEIVLTNKKAKLVNLKDLEELVILVKKKVILVGIALINKKVLEVKDKVKEEDLIMIGIKLKILKENIKKILIKKLLENSKKKEKNKKNKNNIKSTKWLQQEK